MESPASDKLLCFLQLQSEPFYLLPKLSELSALLILDWINAKVLSS